MTSTSSTMQGNNLVATIQIQNVSGTWVYTEQDTTSSPNLVTVPNNGVYLLGPGGTKVLDNVSFAPSSYLRLNATTPVGLDFTSFNPEASALFGALTIDYLMRGLLTTPLAPDAFDDMSGLVDPLLDEVVSSLGDVGQLAVDLKSGNDWAVSQDLATIAVESTGVRDAVAQILSKYVSADQVNNFFENADAWLGVLTDILDVLNLPEKYALLKDLTGESKNL